MLITKKMCNLLAAFQDGLDIVAIVELIAKGLFAGVQIDLLTQGTIIGVGEHGVHIGGGEVEDIAVETFVGGLLRGDGAGAFGNAGKAG